MVMSCDGTLTPSDSVLKYSGGTEMILFFNACTDYNIDGLDLTARSTPESAVWMQSAQPLEIVQASERITYYRTQRDVQPGEPFTGWRSLC